MPGLNILLFFITVIFAILVVFANIYLAKYKWFYTYYFWAPIGAIMLIYFIAARWGWSLQNLISNPNESDQYMFSVLWSKVLLLDMCPLSYVLLGLSLCCDKTRRTSAVVAPITIIGGVITIVGIILESPHDINTVTPIEYIFVGTTQNRLYFMMHFLNIVLGLGVLLNAKTFTKYSFFGQFGFLLGFIIYLLIVTKSLNIQCNASGFVEGDWYTPHHIVGYWFSQYGYVYSLLPIPFPGVTAFWYFIVVVVILFMMYIKNRFTINDYKITQAREYWHIKFNLLTCYLTPLDEWWDKVANKLPRWVRPRYL